ncbi:MAG: hypothetical protein K2K44_00210 [Oscillospiraceae bacterium]|nr:hypothetical protein [Oscillospiraceae bacterium]
MLDFIKKHPCIAVSIVGFFAILLDFLSGQFAAYGWVLFFLFLIALHLLGIFVLIFNIAAMIAVSNDKPVAGVIFSLLLGGFGAFIATLFNPSYEKEKAVKVIFSIQLWLVIWAVVSFMLFELGYYSSGMGIPG